MALPFKVSCGMREADESRIMVTRKIIKRDKSNQNASHLGDNKMKTEGSNVTKTVKGNSNITQKNASFIESLFKRNNHSGGQMVPDNVNKTDKLVIAVSSIEHQFHRRSNGKFLPWNPFAGRKRMNPCVKRIIKTYHSKLRRILTECKCRRATYYCSPTPGGLGRCMAVKTFYPSINKVLTTACKCK